MIISSFFFFFPFFLSFFLSLFICLFIILFYSILFFFTHLYCLVGCLSMIVWTHAVLSVLYAFVLYFCICTCSAQLSMFHMERRSRNMLIIIIITILTMMRKETYESTEKLQLFNHSNHSNSQSAIQPHTLPPHLLPAPSRSFWPPVTEGWVCRIEPETAFLYPESLASGSRRGTTGQGHCSVLVCRTGWVDVYWWVASLLWMTADGTCHSINDTTQSFHICRHCNMQVIIG